MSESGCRGVYHATSQGETSWFDFAKAIFEVAALSVTMRPAGVADFPQKTPRPKYSVLSNEALRREGADIMPHWRESLARHLASAS